MYNRIILMGRLTADPEIMQTQSGISCCRFTIAVDRGYAKQGEERETDFLDCVCWRQTAEFVSRYFAKGRMIHVEGKLKNNNYTDQNGTKHYRNVVQVDAVAFCGGKPGTSPEASRMPQTAATPHATSNYTPASATPQGSQQTAYSATVDYGSLSDYETILGGESPLW